MADARLTNLPNRVGGANTDPIGDNDFLIIANSQTTVSYRITAVGLFDLIRRSENVLNASETTSSIEGYFESINNGKGQVSLANVLGDIPGNRIQNLAVGANQLGNGAVTSAKIGGLQVTNAKLEEASGTTIGAVSTNKIRDRAVTNAKLEDASGSGVGAVSTNKIRDRAITSPKIADGQVTQGKLGANSVLAANIGGGQVIAGKLGSDSIFVNNIRDRQVFGNKIGINGVKEEHLGGASVSTRALADNSVTEAKIANNAITEDKLSFFRPRHLREFTVPSITTANFLSATLRINNFSQGSSLDNNVALIDGVFYGGSQQWIFPFKLAIQNINGTLFFALNRGELSANNSPIGGRELAMVLNGRNDRNQVLRDINVQRDIWGAQSNTYPPVLGLIEVLDGIRGAVQSNIITITIELYTWRQNKSLSDSTSNWTLDLTNNREGLDLNISSMTLSILR